LWTLLLAVAILAMGATISGAGDVRRAHAPTAVVIALALGLSVPGVSGLGQGAISCALGALILCPLLAPGSRVAGVATAVAAVAKIEPALWFGYLAGAGRFRTVLIAAGTGLGIVI